MSTVTVGADVKHCVYTIIKMIPNLQTPLSRGATVGIACTAASTLSRQRQREGTCEANELIFIASYKPLG